jgi:hypothetical protein
MLDDAKKRLEVTLMDIMYIPGLSRRFFSIVKFTRHGFHATIRKNAKPLHFTICGKEALVTLQNIGGGKAMATDLPI